MKHFLPGWCAILLLAACSRPQSQPVLLSGPMLGPVEQREAVAWLEAKASREAEVRFYQENKAVETRTLLFKPAVRNPLGSEIYHLRLAMLEPATAYRAEVRLDGVLVAEDIRFKTQPIWRFRTDPPDFKFILGSCTYFNEEAYDRPGVPYGQDPAVFAPMADSGADFMLWLGDNVYFREGDYTSRSGLWYRWQRERAMPVLAPLLRKMPNYAIWDDHDFGPNDSSKSFRDKETSLEAFKAYWPNPTAGEADNPGIYTQFTWGDAVFFLLDNRYHRDENTLSPKENPGKSQFGKRQLEWLKQGLLAAQNKSNGNCRFKFIAMGGQLLRDHRYESFKDFPDERRELLEFIRKQNITGAVILSGDRHYTEMTRLERPGTYPLLEVTSSPLSSRAYSKPPELLTLDLEPPRVEGTLVVDQNFVEITVAGEKEGRHLVVKCFDKTKALRWEQTIRAGDLEH